MKRVELNSLYYYYATYFDQTTNAEVSS